LRRLILVLLALALVFAARNARAQGGPPMITDDPGTPGNGHWENNLAIAFEHRPNEWSIDTPQFDLNYGWGDHIQLNLQTAPTILKRSDHGAVGGLGGTELAVKWRFLDEERSGLDMSTYPRVIFNIFQSSVRHGLSDDGTRFRLPLEIAKKFGRLELNPEVGALLTTVGRSEWLYGIVAGTDVTKTTELMAELHGTARTNFTRDVLAVNVGFRHKINEHAIWIASLGHELRAPAGESLALIGYCGVQLLY
jgi:hypothetical protein